MEDRTCNLPAGDTTRDKTRLHYLDGKCSWILRSTMVCDRKIRCWRTICSFTQEQLDIWSCQWLVSQLIVNSQTCCVQHGIRQFSSRLPLLNTTSVEKRSTPRAQVFNKHEQTSYYSCHIYIFIFISDHIYHPPRLCFASSWICNAHSRPSMPGILTSRSTRRGFVMWPSVVMAWPSTPCWRIWTAEVFTDKFTNKKSKSVVFPSNWSNLSFWPNWIRSISAFKIKSLRIQHPLPNGTPTATAVNHRPRILVLEVRQVL